MKANIYHGINAFIVDICNKEESHIRLSFDNGQHQRINLSQISNWYLVGAGALEMPLKYYLIVLSY